jgi:hypothetical protein
MLSSDGIIEVDPYKGLTAAQSLQHPWILHRPAFPHYSSLLLD